MEEERKGGREGGREVRNEGERETKIENLFVETESKLVVSRVRAGGRKE
jgi:hypothetical protein